MEASGVVFRPPSRFPGSGINADIRSYLRSSLSGSGNRVLLGDSGTRKFSSSAGFTNNDHVHYYCGRSKSPIVRCVVAKKNEEKVKVKDTTTAEQKKQKIVIKKRLKLLKGLSRDLSMFCGIGFGLDPYNHGLVDQVKGKMISEASELLLAQLKQLRSEQNELKRKRREEKAKWKAAACSSSSSSESSDTECEGEVFDMGRLKCESCASSSSIMTNGLQQQQPPVMQDLEAPLLILTNTSNLERPPPVIPECTQQKIEQECCNSSSSSEKKIEVCLGGKCKKSGAVALLEEFQRLLDGGATAVVGCKCMGKCRDGPNVRVFNSSSNEQVALATAVAADTFVLRTPPPTNPLCIGVGLKDVGLIVSNFLGGALEGSVGVPLADVS